MPLPFLPKEEYRRPVSPKAVSLSPEPDIVSFDHDLEIVPEINRRGAGEEIDGVIDRKYAGSTRPTGITSTA